LQFHEELELLRGRLKKYQDENEIISKDKRELTAKIAVIFFLLILSVLSSFLTEAQNKKRLRSKQRL
jgi:hypothetical protein